MEENAHQFLLATLPPSKVQRRVAVAMVVVLVAAFCITAPFVHTQLAHVDSFIAALATALLINDLITSALLFSQFSIVRRQATLVLAMGYLFSALINIPYALTFPGLLAPRGILGAGLQTTVSLFVMWHIGWLLSVISYALLNDSNSRRSVSDGLVRASICLSVAGVIAVVCALTWLATVQHDLLPKLLLENARLSPLASIAGGLMASLCAVALVALWVRNYSVLDLWLMVTVCAWLLEITLAVLLVTDRFDLGWYMGRIYSLFAGSAVLIMLLSETTMLYARLALSSMRQRREYERRNMTMDSVAASIAHEVNQPLASIVTDGNSALRWLAKTTPDLDEARDSIKRIVREGLRAGEVIGSIRTMFKKGEKDRAPVNINQLIRDALMLLLGEVRAHQVEVQTELSDNLPVTIANRVQLQQVILNLVANALDAMKSVTDRPRVLRLRSEIHESHGVLVVVEDTGTGIETKNIERLFDSFFTTKSDGMGMGLSFCRSIIEAHGGKLSASPGHRYGAVFRIILPG